MLLIRYMYAGRQVWLLYKTSEKAVIARLDVDDGYTLRYGHHGYAEITDEAWERLFRTFSDYQQRPPTRELRKGQRVDGPWPRGYSGTVNLYENGKLRSYLLATEDVKDIHFPNPIGDVVCATLLAGMHCKPGAKTEAGWVEKLLSDQIRHNHSSKHAATLNLCSAAMPCGCDGKKVEDYLADGDINGFTRDGRTCINVAKDGNKPEVVQKLKALGAREDVDNYWKPIKKNACSVHQETQ